MADNLRRAVQDIDLGAEDPPISLPVEVVNEAAVQNRFILMGRPVIPKRQNIRSIIATLPRSWGQAGIVHGRIVEGRRFQFVFPSEEALEMVLRRGPWAFADRMLIMERWTPLMNPLEMNHIPFWIQIRGIPFQFMSRNVIAHIGRTLGELMDVDYNAEAAARIEFVRVRINWNVDDPLRFKRNFQFRAGENTLLRFLYERLRGFCEVCGRLTHDSGGCLQNEGPNPHSDDEDNDSGNDENPEVRDNGAQIQEMFPHVEIENVGDQPQLEGVRHENMQLNDDVTSDDSDEVEEIPHDVDEEMDSDGAYPGEVRIESVRCSDLFLQETEEYEAMIAKEESLRNAKSSVKESLKRKFDDDGYGIGSFQKMERGQSSGNKKKIADDLGRVRGAVGPEPPLPP